MEAGISLALDDPFDAGAHLAEQADFAKEAVREEGAVGLRFDTIAVSDGISMGHVGMHASLVSREVIADSPVAVQYEITPLGRTLQPPFRALYAWTIAKMPEVEQARQAFDQRWAR